MTKTIRPSGRAYEAARRLAREAARNDNWMEPCPEEHTEDTTNLGEISQRHRDGWQGTVHFHHYYGDQLSDLTDQQERRFGGDLVWEDRFYGIYLELLDAFWDEWEEKVGFYPKAEEALREM